MANSGGVVEAAQAGAWFSGRRIALLVAVIGVLAAAFFVASSLTRPGSAPSVLEKEIEKMEAAVQAAPNDVALRLDLANAYQRAGHTQEALGQFQQALVIDEKSEEALLGAGVAHQELGQTEQAVRAFTTIVAQNGENPYAQMNQRLQAAHFYLGRISRQQGSLDEAVNHLRAALGINRADADTLYELGLAFQAKGENADAASAFEVALAYVPDFVEAYQGLAEAARAEGHEGKAGFAEAMALVLQGKVKEGARRLERLAPESEDSRVWWGLGYANERLGRPEEAREAYRRAVEINPGERLAEDALARLETAE